VILSVSPTQAYMYGWRWLVMMETLTTADDC
jgi:hypothetical protein